jgi:hypothetical protein
LECGSISFAKQGIPGKIIGKRWNMHTLRSGGIMLTECGITHLHEAGEYHSICRTVFRWEEANLYYTAATGVRNEEHMDLLRLPHQEMEYAYFEVGRNHAHRMRDNPLA